MLILLEARNRQGALLALPLDDIANGFAIADIDGLDPVKATITSSSFAQRDGTQYQSARREARNIKITLDLEPDYILASVRDLRNQLYEFFMPKSEVFLRFYDNTGLTVDISGRVESCGAPLFAQDPQAVISIMCFDPDFIDLVEVLHTETTTEDSDEFYVPYTGTVETGIRFSLNVDRSLSEFTIYHRAPDDILRSMEFTYPFLAGDVLTINTITGEKGVTLNRSGSDIPLLYAKSPQSGWIELDKGDNYIRVHAEGEEIPFSITYIPKYGGL